MAEGRVSSVCLQLLQAVTGAGPMHRQHERHHGGCQQLPRVEEPTLPSAGGGLSPRFIWSSRHRFSSLLSLMAP